MKAIVITKSQPLGHLKVSEVKKPQIGDSDVLIKIKAIGVNYADLLAVQGIYNWNPKTPYILGLECSGVVEKTGKNVKKHRVGDKVVVPTKGGAYAEYIVKDEDALLPLPQNMDYYQGASLSGNWATAWTAIFEMARTREGENILIHSAAGGVGVAAVTLAKAASIKVYGTTSTRLKQKYIKKLGAAPLDYKSFYSFFSRNIEEKPDTIIESVGGDVHNKSKKILAPMGRMITLGATSIKLNKHNPLSWYVAWKKLPQIKRSDLVSQGYMSLHMGHLFENNRGKIEPVWKRMINFMNKYNLKPTVNEKQIFSLTKVNKAHLLMENRKNIGKIILDPSM